MNRLKNLWYKWTAQCGLCGRGLFRHGTHGAVDIPLNIGGSKKKTVYLCNFCYFLIKKLDAKE